MDANVIIYFCISQVLEKIAICSEVVSQSITGAGFVIKQVYLARTVEITTNLDVEQQLLRIGESGAPVGGSDSLNMDILESGYTLHKCLRKYFLHEGQKSFSSSVGLPPFASSI